MTQQVRWSVAGPGRERGVLCDEAGRELSWLFMESPRVRIAGAVVRAGMVGGVETLKECRGKGYGRLMMEDALRRFGRKSCDIGFLFGIPAYYRKFGYDTVVPYHAMVLDLWRAKPLDAEGVRCRPFEPGDEAGLCRLYATDNAGRTGTFVRSTANWGTGSGSRQLDQALCAVDAAGRLRGYAKRGGELFLARWMGEELLPSAVLVPEIAALDAAAAGALIHRLAADASSQQRRYLLVLCPLDSVAGAALFTLGGQYRHAVIPDSGGIQARIVRLLPLMQSLEADLSDRLRQSCFAAVDRRLTLSTGESSVELRIRRGRVTVEEGDGEGLMLAPGRLAQLVFGFLPASGLAGEDGRVIDVLFPRQHAHAWALDEVV